MPIRGVFVRLHFLPRMSGGKCAGAAGRGASLAEASCRTVSVAKRRFRRSKAGFQRAGGCRGHIGAPPRPMPSGAPPARGRVPRKPTGLYFVTCCYAPPTRGRASGKLRMNEPFIRVQAGAQNRSPRTVRFESLRLSSACRRMRRTDLRFCGLARRTFHLCAQTGNADAKGRAAMSPGACRICARARRTP